MMKKFLWSGLLASVMLCFLFQSTATASRINLTLGWHNLDDWFIINATDNNNLLDARKIDSGLLDKSKFRDPLTSTNEMIKLAGLGFNNNDVDVVKLKMKRQSKRFFKKGSKKAFKKAAKKSQRFKTGGTSGWKAVYNEWRSMDKWTLYNENDYVADAFDKIFDGTKFKGEIDGQKVRFTARIFENSATPIATADDNGTPSPVPEPATMVLFGLGLLGLAGVSRKKLQ